MDDWDFIGQVLGLTAGKLREIEGENSKLKRRMMDVLLTWMYGNGTKPVTWRTLLKALEDPKVGKKEVAKKIKAKLIQNASSPVN